MLHVNPLLPVLIMLECSEVEWEAYIKSLRKQYETIQNIVHYSKVGTAKHDPFEICFKDTQKLELISHKLSICSSIITNSLDIATGCLKYVDGFNEHIEVQEAACNKIDFYVRRMKMHATSVNLLLTQSNKTMKLVSYITAQYSEYLLIL
jgi:hypothetical protein